MCERCYLRWYGRANAGRLAAYGAAWRRQRNLERITADVLAVLRYAPGGLSLRDLRTRLGPFHRRTRRTVEDVARLLAGRVLVTGTGRRQRWRAVTS